MGLEELRALLTRHARPDMTTAVDGVLASKIERPAAPYTSMTGTVLALIAQGEKRLALGDRVYDYRAGQYLVASVDLPVTGHFVEVSPEHPALGFGLVLRPSVVAELLLRAGPADIPPAPGSAPSGIAVSNAPDELVDAAVRMLRLLDRPCDATVLAPLIEREIVWWLLTGEQGATVRQLGLADSSLAHVARAVGWIRDHYAESFRVQDAARVSGMTVSAFYRNFQAVTAKSPIQFQKQIRLQGRRSSSPPTHTMSRASATARATTAPRSSAASTAGSSALHPAATLPASARPRSPPYRLSFEDIQAHSTVGVVAWTHPIERIFTSTHLHRA
jgi:hypothetical protein